MTLAQKLNYLMLSAGISQIELAQATKIERSTLTRILNNSTTQPKIDTIFTLAKYFKVDVSELVEAMQHTDSSNNSAQERNIQNNLRILMKTFNIKNTSELGRKSSLPVNVLSDILNGKTSNPKIKTLQMLANFFNISIPQLCGIDELPEFKNEAITHSIQKTVPLLNFEQIKLWLQERLPIQKLYLFSVNVQRDNHLQFAIKVNDNSFFPDILKENILLIDNTVHPIKKDFIILEYEETISIYEYLNTLQGKVSLRKAGTSTFLDVPSSLFSPYGTVIQQIINRT